MSTLTIGIVNYGMGNHASIMYRLKKMGFKVRISNDSEVLNDTDVLILPGVGAFPSAMQSLHDHGLVNYLKEQAEMQRPLIGICLGMQLLTTASYEFDYTLGLDLIEGEVVPLKTSKWHIGWNTIKCIQKDSLLQASDNEAFYFNHSYSYQGSKQYQVARTEHLYEIASIIRKGNIVGLQFHPEKSQFAGEVLLKNLILELVDAAKAFNRSCHS